jgi:hypothetical protein
MTDPEQERTVDDQDGIPRASAAEILLDKMATLTARLELAEAVRDEFEKAAQEAEARVGYAELEDKIVSQAARLELAEAVVEKARGLHHWADTHFNAKTGETEGVAVSAEKWREMFESIYALDASKEQA